MFRKDSNFYLRVDKQMEGHWRTLFFWILVINIVSISINTHSDVIRTVNYLNDLIFTGFNQQKLIDYLMVKNSFNLISSIIGLITSILTLVLNMEILDFVRTGRFEIENIVKYIKNNPLQVLGVSVILYVLPIITGYIPIVGSLIYYVLYYGFSYVSCLVLITPKNTPITLFKNSWKLTDGNKIELVNKVIHYYGIVWVGYILAGFGLLIVILGSITDFTLNNICKFGLVTMLFGIIWAVYFRIKNTPYLYLASAMYFKEHMNYKDKRL